MKKVVKSCTFWFALLGIIVVILNLLKLDDMNILMIGLNPLLNIFSSSKPCRDLINSVPYLWQILSFITMVGYGLIIDGIRRLIKKAK